MLTFEARLDLASNGSTMLGYGIISDRSILINLQCQCRASASLHGADQSAPGPQVVKGD